LNTLVLEILERRREIGIMKTTWATSARLKRISLWEAGRRESWAALWAQAGWAHRKRCQTFATNIYLGNGQDFRPEKSGSYMVGGWDCGRFYVVVVCWQDL